MPLVNGCFACQTICVVFSLHSGMSKAVHPQEPFFKLKMDFDHWHFPAWASHSVLSLVLVSGTGRFIMCKSGRRKGKGVWTLCCRVVPDGPDLHWRGPPSLRWTGESPATNPDEQHPPRHSWLSAVKLWWVVRCLSFLESSARGGNSPYVHNFLRFSWSSLNENEKKKMKKKEKMKKKKRLERERERETERSQDFILVMFSEREKFSGQQF